MTELEKEKLNAKYKLTRSPVFLEIIKDIDGLIKDVTKSITANVPNADKSISEVAAEDMHNKGFIRGLNELRNLNFRYKTEIEMEKRLEEEAE